jgi:hypothetical protein
MANLSFARIMYGANEGIHSMHGMGGPAFVSHASNAGPQNSAKAGAGSRLSTLGKLLQNTWAIFTGKP